MHDGQLRLHPLTICNTYCTATMVTRTRLDVTLYVHCLSCFSCRVSNPHHSVVVDYSG